MASTGKGFELSVLNTLKYHYENQGARIIYDCDFYEEGKDKTTQIDILMVLRSGVYVIECKDWQDKISDDGGRFIWHQKYIDDYGVEKERTYHSPVVQNRKHSNWINKVVPGNVPVYSFVVFSERGDLSDVDTDVDDTYVLYREELTATIDGIDSSTDKYLSETRIKMVYTLLEEYVAREDEDDHPIELECIAEDGTLGLEEGAIYQIKEVLPSGWLSIEEERGEFPPACFSEPEEVYFDWFFN